MDDKKEESEYLKHYIVIDEFMELEWKIPKVITPLQLKAMNSKVNKLFNLSEVPIAEVETVKRTYKTIRGSHWTPELKQKVVELYKSGFKGKAISDEIYKISGDSFFKEPNAIHRQLNYMKKTGDIKRRYEENVTSKVPQEKKVRNKKGINKRFEQEDIDYIKFLWLSGKRNSREIRDALNEKSGKLFTNKQMADKIYNLKHKGEISNEPKGTVEIKLQESQTSTP